MHASDSAMLFVIMTPTGPLSPSPVAMSLLASPDVVRAWPGGTGAHKIGGNYAPTFVPLHHAIKQGYNQCLWIIGDTVTEVGAMNFFIVLKRDDGGQLKGNEQTANFC